MTNKSWPDFLKQHKTLLLVVIIGFILIEVEIYALSAMRSGTQYRTQILNPAGEVIYELKGAKLSSFDKYYFENTFGPLENFKIRLKTFEVPFPFRAWFSASVCIPVGFVLLLAFIIKAVMTFLQGNSGERKKSEKSERKNFIAGAESFLLRVSRFNIFIIGFLIFLAVFLYWVIPNMLSFLARTGIETLVNFKWVFVGGVAAVFVLFAWFMYMKFQLAKKSLEAETEIRKYELLLVHEKADRRAGALEYRPEGQPKRIDHSKLDLEENS